MKIYSKCIYQNEKCTTALLKHTLYCVFRLKGMLPKVTMKAALIWIVIHVLAEVLTPYRVGEEMTSYFGTKIPCCAPRTDHVGHWGQRWLQS